MIETIIKIIIPILFVVIFQLMIHLTETFEKCYIYISYADQDENRVKFAIEVIKKQLQRRWWISYKILTKRDIPLGEPMTHIKYSFIRRSEVCIVFLSNNYVESSDCKDELALMRNLKVIPIFLDWNQNISECSKAIIDKNGIFLMGCYSHRLIESKMKILAKEL